MRPTAVMAMHRMFPCREGGVAGWLEGAAVVSAAAALSGVMVVRALSGVRVEGCVSGDHKLSENGIDLKAS